LAATARRACGEEGQAEFSERHDVVIPNASVLPEEADFTPWLIATASLSHDEAVAVLSDPHYIENDSTRTAGGAEDHWAFSFPCGMKIAIVLRCPYEEASIYADPPMITTALEHLAPLVTGRELRVAERPVLDD